jgi:hypothetical protein
MNIFGEAGGQAMKIYLVTVSDCEGIHSIQVCATLKDAETELFKTRDKLIAQWKEALAYQKENGYADDMYPEMIRNLSSNDYKNWNNYPHEVARIIEYTVLVEEDKP